MYSLFKSLISKYLSIYNDLIGAIGFICSAQSHQGLLYTLPLDSGAPVQFSPRLLAPASAVT